MHILYLVENIDVAGGIERSLTTRVNYLVELGTYEITIVCTQKKTGIPYYELNPNVKLLFLEPLTSKKTVLGRISLRYSQSKQIVQLKSDIIVSVKYSLHNVFFQFLRKKQKLISEIREPKEQYDLNLTSIKSKCNAIIRNYVFKKQDRLIVLTKIDKINWGFNNIAVVPNSTTINPKNVSDLNKKQVLALGRLHPIKGYTFLISAWKKVLEKHNDWHLKICGAGDEYENLLNLCVKLNLKKNITITNQFLSVVPQFLDSSIFVLTSQYEAFGNVLVEAKSCGVPSIAFDAPSGPREIIKHDEDGFLIPLNDVDALADKIIFLIENESLRKEMGRKAKINSEEFQIDKIMDKYIHALNDIN